MCNVYERGVWVLFLGLCVGWYKNDETVVFDEQGLQEAYTQGEMSQERYVQLLEWLREPLHVCEASWEQWMLLPHVTEAQAEAVLRWCEEKKFFQNHAQVREVLNMPGVWYEVLKPFVCVQKTSLHALGVVWAQPQGVAHAGQVQAQKSGVQAGVGWVLQDVAYPVWNADAKRLEVLRKPGALRLARAYVGVQKKRYDVWLGHYQWGAGEGLTFGRSGHAQGASLGWFMQEDRQAGKFRDSQALLGLALNLRGAWRVPVQASVFASFKPQAVYQYDMTYGDQSHALWEHGTQQKATYVTLWDSAWGAVWGGQVWWKGFAESIWGLVGYQARTFWRIPQEAGVHYAASARMPENGRAHALGAYMRCGHGRVGCGLEYTWMPSEGMGFFGRWSYRKKTLYQYETRVRYYSRGFNNPYAQAYAAPDEEEGVRARDEAGVYSKIAWGEEGRVFAVWDVWKNASSLFQKTNPQTSLALFYSFPVTAYENVVWGVKALSQGESTRMHAVLKSHRHVYADFVWDIQWGVSHENNQHHTQSHARVRWTVPWGKGMKHMLSVRYAQGMDHTWEGFYRFAYTGEHWVCSLQMQGWRDVVQGKGHYAVRLGVGWDVF